MQDLSRLKLSKPVEDVKTLVGTVTVIGAGVIGGAIVKCLIKSKKAESVIATRRNLETLISLADLGANISDNNLVAAKEAEIVFICVKPNDIEQVLIEIKDEIEGKLVISTAAVIPISSLEAIMPNARYVRTMPNIAAMVGESFTAYTMGSNTLLEDKTTVETLLNTMGTCMEIEEKYMDAVTGLSGSGPAFVAIVIEALTYAGLRVGLPRDLSKVASAQSVLGAAKLIMNEVMTPSEIAEMVTTPGGTTIEGIYQIEDGKLRTALMNAVKAATEKSSNIRSKWANK